jgi:hypothetical protein
MAETPISLIYGERLTTGVPAEVRGAELWLRADDLERATGWAFKPQGFCKGEVCVPVPPARAGEFEAGDRYNLTAIAELLGQPMVADEEHHAWCVGEAAAERARTLKSLDAPDFSLPDLAGRMHSLSEYRGKKVLLVSWASW